MSEHHASPKLESVPLIPDQTVRKLIDTDLAMQAIEQAYADYGRERRVLSSPPAQSLTVTGGTDAAFKIKGARLKSLGVAGFRMIADRMVDGAEHTVDFCWVAVASTGRIIGLVDETWLHRLRTALTGVVAVKWLARPQSRIVAIIGAGKIADELPGPLARVLDLQEIRIAARRPESARAFAERHAAVAEVKPFTAVRAAIAGADIIIGISSAATPVLHARDLTPGALVCGMGGGAEIAADVLTRADRFIIDDLDYALTIGSVHGWIEQGIGRDTVARRIDADMGELAIGAKAGRRRDDDIVLAIVQGMACCDIALANLALARAGLRPVS